MLVIKINGYNSKKVKSLTGGNWFIDDQAFFA